MAHYFRVRRDLGTTDRANHATSELQEATRRVAGTQCARWAGLNSPTGKLACLSWRDAGTMETHGFDAPQQN